MIRKLSVVIAPLLLFLAPAFAVSDYEAEAELMKLYGADTVSASSADWRNEYTSISRFVAAAVKSKEMPLILVYNSSEGEECGKILLSFFSRRRVASTTASSHATTAQQKNMKIHLVNADVLENNHVLLSNYKTVLIGRIADYPFTKRMASRGKIKAAKNRAQFRLFANPNSLAIVSESSKILPELARVFVKSWKEFDDDNYSYFYLE